MSDDRQTENWKRRKGRGRDDSLSVVTLLILKLTVLHNGFVMFATQCKENAKRNTLTDCI